MRQINILPAGVQCWHKEVIGSAVDGGTLYFAYASTLAVYLYRKDSTDKPRLWKILTGHTKSIRCLEWASHNYNAIVTAGSDGKVVIWNVAEEREEMVAHPAAEGSLVGVALCDRIRWNGRYKGLQRNPQAEVLCMGYSDGSLYRWASDTNRVVKFSDAAWSCFEWQGPDELLVGTHDGQLCRVTCPQQPPAKSGGNVVMGTKKVLFTHPEQSKQGPRCDCMAKDPLCEDYLITAFSDGSLFLLAAADGAILFAFERLGGGGAISGAGSGGNGGNGSAPGGSSSSGNFNPVEKILWLPSQPGNFLTCHAKTATLQLWNASQPKPLEKLKAGSQGPIFTVTRFATNNPERLLVAHTNGAVTLLDVTSNTGTGGVGATKITTLRPQFTTSAAHSETIFDLCFCPANCNVFATVSYDGYVRLWNVAKRESFREMYAGDGILYAVAFSRDGSMIAAVSGYGNLFVWKAETGALILKYKAHDGNLASYRLNWCPDDPNLIATGGCDNFAVITSISDKCPRRSYRHPLVVIGVAFNPHSTNIFCTACQDGLVRVWDTKVFPHHHQPLFALSGHTGRVFNVTWHPFFRNLLASGSDDTTIRVWDVDKQCECIRLCGHRSFVRALCWHAEVCQILLSGSWDESIRVWDVSQGICLYTARQHHADVYGLDAHPMRPFMFVSSSRDTTIRFWTLEEIAAPYLLAGVLAPQELGKLAGSADAVPSVCGPEFFATNTPPSPNPIEATWPFMKHITVGGTSTNRSPVLYPHTENLLLFGEGFQRLLYAISTLPPHPLRVLRVYRLLFNFFHFRTNLDDIWALLEHCITLGTAGVAGGPSSGVSSMGAGTAGTDEMDIHRTISCTAGPKKSGGRLDVDVIMNVRPDLNRRPSVNAALTVDSSTQIWHQNVLSAQVKTQALSLASQSGQIGSGMKKEERLQNAAQMMLRVGNVRQYCEFMAQADQWEKAIMAAPMVSTEFWQKMYRDYLQRKGYCLSIEGRAVGLLATENADELVDGYLRESMLSEALTTAKTQADGAFFTSAAVAGGSGGGAGVMAQLHSVPPDEHQGAAGSNSPIRGPGGVLIGTSATASSSSAGGGSSRTQRLHSVSQKLADQYYASAEPVAAACLLFSVNAVEAGLDMLLRGNEILLYHVCYSLLKKPTASSSSNRGSPGRESGGSRSPTRGSGGEPPTSRGRDRSSSFDSSEISTKARMAMELLAKQCERYKLRERAHELFTMSGTDSSLHRAELLAKGVRCPRAGGNLGVDGNNQELRGRFESMKASPTHDSIELTKLALQLGEFEWAAQTALDTMIIEIASRETGDLAKVRSLLAVLECCNLTQLSVQVVVSLLACAAYSGFVVALTSGYVEVLHAFAQTIQNIVVHRQLAFPVSAAELFALDAVMHAKCFPRDVKTMEKLGIVQGAEIPTSLMKLVQDHLAWVSSAAANNPTAVSPALGNKANAHWLLDMIEDKVWNGLGGPSMMLAGSLLPSEREAPVSVLSNEVIRGPSFLLEDGQSCVALKEALLWGRVNTCSPLNTGYPVEPF
ncbi:unnamed protein product [Amoebophrya sp. A120]|nr:unnamed protein product [Amoebophrya sp. A120]|eukprot:GSA120T00018373001.1